MCNMLARVTATEATEVHEICKQCQAKLKLLGVLTLDIAGKVLNSLFSLVQICTKAA